MSKWATEFSLGSLATIPAGGLRVPVPRRRLLLASLLSFPQAHLLRPRLLNPLGLQGYSPDIEVAPWSSRSHLLPAEASSAGRDSPLVFRLLPSEHATPISGGAGAGWLALPTSPSPPHMWPLSGECGNLRGKAACLSLECLMEGEAIGPKLERNWLSILHGAERM